MNTSEHDRIIELPFPRWEEARWEDLLRGGTYEVGPDYGLVVKLPALSGTVLRQG